MATNHNGHSPKKKKSKLNRKAHAEFELATMKLVSGGISKGISSAFMVNVLNTAMQALIMTHTIRTVQRMAGIKKN